MKFQEYDVVRITCDLPALRIDAGVRQPREGDLGAILMVYPRVEGSDQAYAVECVAEDGSTTWLADITQPALELSQSFNAGAA